MLIVDAHEDIAWNILTFGRDYSRSVAETREREKGSSTVAQNGDTMLGLADWISGGVAVVIGSLFATPIRHKEGAWDTQCYQDEREAEVLYSAQMDAYERLVDRHPDGFQLIRGARDLAAVLSAWEQPAAAHKVGLVISIEGADGIVDPLHLDTWYERGVRMVGPAWSGTRYAGGTREPGPFSSLGFQLLEAMAELEMGLDLSHLTDEAVFQALDRFPGQILASHSTCRALVPNSPVPERHLPDEAIRRIAEREGVIGVALYNRFLADGWQPADGRDRVTIGHVVAHIDHICQLLGDANHVGLGSDFDGGYGLEAVPTGLDSVADLRFIGDALRARGYHESEIEAMMSRNWLNFLGRVLKE
jgi:membrane dipeptidase